VKIARRGLLLTTVPLPGSPGSRPLPFQDLHRLAAPNTMGTLSTLLCSAGCQLGAPWWCPAWPQCSVTFIPLPLANRSHGWGDKRPGRR